MDFATLMAQIHAADLDDASVEDIVAMSSAAPTEEDPFIESMMSIPGVDTPALRDFLIDYLDMMAVGGVGGAQYDLVEIDNMPGFQLVQLADKYGVDLERFKK